MMPVRSYHRYDFGCDFVVNKVATLYKNHRQFYYRRPSAALDSHRSMTGKNAIFSCTFVVNFKFDRPFN